MAQFRETGDRPGEAGVLNDLGATLLASGRGDEARTRHASALDLATQIGDQYQQARAHDGLACACHDAADLEQARHHWQQALERYADLGAAETSTVRAHLAALSPSTTTPSRPE